MSIQQTSSSNFSQSARTFFGQGTAAVQGPVNQLRTTATQQTQNTQVVSLPQGIQQLPNSMANPIRTIGEALSQQLRQYQQAAEFGSTQRQRDAANGVSVWEGVRTLTQRSDNLTFAKELSQGLSGAGSQTLLALAQDPRILPQLLEGIGSSAQQAVLRELYDDAIAFGLKQLGIEGAATSSGAATVTATQAGAAQTTTQAGAAQTAATTEGSSIAGSWVGAAAALYSGYQMIDSWGQSTPATGAMQGAAMGAYVGSVIPGVGTAIGAIAGAVLGGIAGSISSGKHPDQRLRDSARDFLQERGILNAEHQIRLADGTSYDFGPDGRHRYQNLDGTSRAPYQIDFSNPLTGQAIGWVAPLAEVLMGGNEKLRTDFTGYFVNAATSNATTLEGVRANLLHFYEQAGLPVEAIVQGLDQLRSRGTIDQGRFDAYINGLRTLVTANEQAPVAN